MTAQQQNRSAMLAAGIESGHVEIIDARETDTPAPPKPDFLFVDHGSICILNALTPGAVLWVAEHLPDDRMTFGPDGTVIEPRYVADIVSGIHADNLTIVD